MTTRTRRCCFVQLLGVIILAFLASEPARTQGARDKSIFVAAVDEAGRPVKDLTVNEFLIREDGADREVVGLKPATDPLQISVLGDTTESAEDFIRDIRVALTAFVRQVHATSPDAQISLMEFGQAAMTITPFTTSTADLEKGITRLVAKPRAASVLLEGLIDASNNLSKRPSPRRAIVVLNMEPSNEQSRQEPNKINESLGKSVAQLWAVSLQNGALRNATRDVVLNVLTKNTGGRREFIMNQSALEAVLKSYADVLTSQYELTYKRPDSARSPKQVQVGVMRQGLKLHASGFAPR